MREDVKVAAAQLIDFHIPNGTITEAGLRNNISVGILYTEAWLRGNGAVAINNLMEDAATAEISRSQVWQWLQRGARLEDGTVVTADLIHRIEDEELAKLPAATAPGRRFEDARRILEAVALADEYVEFLTLPAYEEID